MYTTKEQFNNQKIPKRHKKLDFAGLWDNAVKEKNEFIFLNLYGFFLKKCPPATKYHINKFLRNAGYE